jgi:hypothetical protein
VVKKCIIFFRCEEGRLVHLPEEESVREAVSGTANRNWLAILEIVIDAVYSIMGSQPFFPFSNSTGNKCGH